MKIAYDGTLNPVTYKDVFSALIQSMIADDPDVFYLDADLMSCMGTTKWSAENPGHSINCGIAEANMVGVACGLAAAGFKPILHTFGPFASRRVYDQAFLSAGYAHNDITIIGSDPGVTAALNGGTHMPFEDMALYRALPGCTVIDISDTEQFISVLKQAKDRPGVKYIRTTRKNTAKLYESGTETPIGKGIVLREGTDAVIVASGIMVHESMQAAQQLAKEGIEAAVIDMFTVKPLDEELLLAYAKKTGAVVTAENHNRIGGLRSAVAESLMASCLVPLAYVAVEDAFGEVGPQDYLQQRFGLTAEHIAAQVRAVIARKK